MDDPTMPASALAPAGEDPDDLLWQAAEILVPPPALAIVPDGGPPAEPEATSKEPWRIRDDGAAEWAMATLAETEAEIAAVIAHAESVKRRAEEWASEVLHARRTAGDGRQLPSLMESRSLLTAHLEAYGRSERERETGSRATVSLVHGAVRTRRANEQVVIEDPKALLAWAKDNAPEMVKVTEEVQVSTLRKWVKPAKGQQLVLAPPAPVEGEPEDPRKPVMLDAIPGVAVEPEGVTVTVAPVTAER